MWGVACRGHLPTLKECYWSKILNNHFFMKNVFFMSQKKFQRWDSTDVDCRLITYFFFVYMDRSRMAKYLKKRYLTNWRKYCLQPIFIASKISWLVLLINLTIFVCYYGITYYLQECLGLFSFLSSCFKQTISAFSYSHHSLINHYIQGYKTGLPYPD